MNLSRMTNVVDLCSCGNQLLSQSTALITKRIVFRRCYHRRWQTAEPDVQWAPHLEFFSVDVRHPLL